MDATTKPRIALVGLSGAGKTTLGQALAGRLGWPFHDLDEDVTRLAGIPVAEVFSREGESGFRAREHQALTIRAGDPGPLVCALGAGAVLDPRNRDLLRRAFQVIWIQVDPAEAARRLAGATDRPLLSRNPERDLERLLDERRGSYRDVADQVFLTRTLGKPAGEAERLHSVLVQMGLISLS